MNEWEMFEKRMDKFRLGRERQIGKAGGHYLFDDYDFHRLINTNG